MRKLRYVFISATLLSAAACSTLDNSMRLGATMGSLAGVATTHAAHNSIGEKPNSEDVLLGATIGMGIGLITSYFTHKNVEKERQSLRHDKVEVHYGDLPPSPFLVPFKKKGGR